MINIKGTGQQISSTLGFMAGCSLTSSKILTVVKKSPLYFYSNTNLNLHVKQERRPFYRPFQWSMKGWNFSDNVKEWNSYGDFVKSYFLAERVIKVCRSKILMSVYYILKANKIHVFKLTFHKENSLSAKFDTGKSKVGCEYLGKFEGRIRNALRYEWWIWTVSIDSGKPVVKIAWYYPFQ